MHLLTLSLLGLLFRNRGNAEPGLAHHRGGPVRLVHSLPGRARFSISGLKSNTGQADQLSHQLTQIDGIKSVAVNTRTGSVLVLFEPGVLDVDLLFAALIKLLGLEEELLRVPVSIVSREFQEITGALDRALYDQTGGLLDLRTGLAASLASLGLYELLIAKRNLLPPGMTLLWWSYMLLSSEGRNRSK